MVAIFLAALVFFYWMGGPKPLKSIEEPIAVPDTVKGE